MNVVSIRKHRKRRGKHRQGVGTLNVMETHFSDSFSLQSFLCRFFVKKCRLTFMQFCREARLAGLPQFNFVDKKKFYFQKDICFHSLFGHVCLTVLVNFIKLAVSLFISVLPPFLGLTGKTGRWMSTSCSELPFIFPTLRPCFDTFVGLLHYGVCARGRRTVLHRLSGFPVHQGSDRGVYQSSELGRTPRNILRTTQCG